MQARGTDWVARSNGRRQIARSLTAKEGRPLELSYLSDLASSSSYPPPRLPLDEHSMIVAPCRAPPLCTPPVRLPRPGRSRQQEPTSATTGTSACAPACARAMWRARWRGAPSLATTGGGWWWWWCRVVVVVVHVVVSDRFQIFLKMLFCISYTQPGGPC